MNPKLIVIDGKTYKSVDEMPADIRQKYEQAMLSLGDANNNPVPDAFETVSSETASIFADKDKDGVPDVMENMISSYVSLGGMKIIVDGREYEGLENLPPEARAQYEEAMAKIDANKNGMPDFLENMLTTNQTANVSTGFATEMPRRAAPLFASPTITPDTSNGWMLALAGLFILLLCVAGAAGIWYFFLR